MGKTSTLVLAAAAAAIVALAGCTGTPPGPTPSSSTSAATTTSSSPGTEPGTPSATTPPSSPPASTTAPLTIYYIAMADNGASGPMVGCGDSAVATTSAPQTFTDPVAAAMTALLANHAAQLGQSGLDNTLWQSNLAVDSVTRSGGIVLVALSGGFVQGGECDTPRIIAQLTLTAQAAAGSETVDITVNGVPLQEALSLK
ncbi:GerMN domain-containing protein [Arthrobacter sp. 35W]|uniref:GerMN domain-containing protein n=1 Tax=Arthrobacter sp. 35W TaxID=1132441 RepID=UPI00041A662F|nr:GerMN domain-containing protein [Arthrobacter sp. 35W]